MDRVGQLSDGRILIAMSSDEYATIHHPDRPEVRPRADDPFVGDLPELAQGDVQLFRICKALRRSGDKSQFTRSWLIAQLRAIQHWRSKACPWNTCAGCSISDRPAPSSTEGGCLS